MWMRNLKELYFNLIFKLPNTETFSEFEFKKELFPSKLMSKVKSPVDEKICSNVIVLEDIMFAEKISIEFNLTNAFWLEETKFDPVIVYFDLKPTSLNFGEISETEIPAFVC